MPSGYYGNGGQGANPGGAHPHPHPHAQATSELWLVFRDEGQSLHDMLYHLRVEGSTARFVRYVMSPAFCLIPVRSSSRHLKLTALCFCMLVSWFLRLSLAVAFVDGAFLIKATAAFLINRKCVP
jgi:hypothetical protein